MAGSLGMEFQVLDRTVLSVVVGSRAYGLETEESDTDRRGVFVVPTPLFWRLDKPPAHMEGPLPEQFSWEVERFCELALRANPTVLECLWTPIVERSAPQGDELRAMRRAFLSRRALETFGEYADRQFRRLARPSGSGGRDETREPDESVERRRRKMAMHAIRVTLSAVHLARHGEPLVRVDGHRDRLLAVRRGEAGWDEVWRWRDDLARELRDLSAAGVSALPGRPDRDRVEEFLVSVRRSAL
ncbi:nucleotidyltransferase domain-containing protein [Microbispora sp. ATCC PTA-5024]|uniref:nucleotidyltransferase domain-containing protein n=1 Tax=Microbispora sp. ATCC PTA-5024 TaxID=316330 RepID=UPI0012ED1E79|nr:nucleotidyltransferase domain-containing protein [Microbispora sp. ATCC PTA-5024]